MGPHLGDLPPHKEKKARFLLEIIGNERRYDKIVRQTATEALDALGISATEAERYTGGSEYIDATFEKFCNRQEDHVHQRKILSKLLTVFLLLFSLVVAVVFFFVINGPDNQDKPLNVNEQAPISESTESDRKL
jgi:hypothetical protein